jgi:hypothetical protein
MELVLPTAYLLCAISLYLCLQVHKARLRRFKRDQLRSLARRERGLMAELRVAAGDSAWSICNSHGISLAELAAANRQVELDDLQVRGLVRGACSMPDSVYGRGVMCVYVSMCWQQQTGRWSWMTCR